MGRLLFLLDPRRRAPSPRRTPPNQRPLSRFPKLESGRGAPRVGRLAVGSERATWPRCRRASACAVACAVTERRGVGARDPRPPGPAPAPWPAAPPRGASRPPSSPAAPRAARGRREYSRGRPVGRLPAGPAGGRAAERVRGPPPPAGADEVKGLDRVVTRGPPGLGQASLKAGWLKTQIGHKAAFPGGRCRGVSRGIRRRGPTVAPKGGLTACSGSGRQPVSGAHPGPSLHRVPGKALGP